MQSLHSILYILKNTKVKENKYHIIFKINCTNCGEHYIGLNGHLSHYLHIYKHMLSVKLGKNRSFGSRKSYEHQGIISSFVFRSVDDKFVDIDSVYQTLQKRSINHIIRDQPYKTVNLATGINENN